MPLLSEHSKYNVSNIDTQINMLLFKAVFNVPSWNVYLYLNFLQIHTEIVFYIWTS